MIKNNQIRKFELYDLLSIGDPTVIAIFNSIKNIFADLKSLIQEDGCITYFTSDNKILIVYQPVEKFAFFSYNEFYGKKDAVLEYDMDDSTLIYASKKYLNIDVNSVDYMIGISNHKLSIYKEVIEAKQINDHIHAVTT